MTKSIDHYNTGVKSTNNNNIDLLRLVLSYYVVYAHCRILSGHAQYFPSVNLPVDVAVQGFFVLSGYLIFKSFSSTNNIYLYIKKRFMRIYPAYAIVVIFSATGLFFVSELSIFKYFGDEFFLYLGANLTFLNFLQPTLPGVFSSNAVTDAVNGSLWTIKVEVAFYALVPVFAVMMRSSKTIQLALLISAYYASHLFSQFMTSMALENETNIYEIVGKQLPGQLRFFIVGALIFYLRLESSLFLKIGGILSVLFFIFSRPGEGDIIYPIVLGLIVLSFSFNTIAINLKIIGDLSYGAYLIHFPVIQLIVLYGVFDFSLIVGTTLTFFVVSVLALLSWHCIEKPMLQRPHNKQTHQISISHAIHEKPAIHRAEDK